jgi:ABC-2 type transport system permease protein
MLLHLLKIDLKKLTNYRTFWVVGGLYFMVIGFGAASGMEFLKLLARMIEGFGQSINIDRIPLYHFPDVWTNLIWTAGLVKVVVAVLVVISVTNEFTYRTARQNIIDGMSRWEFLLSKILTNVLLAAASVLILFLVGLGTGFIYSPVISFDKIITDLEFFPAYFLEVFMFLSYALMLGMLVQRSGLTIILLLLSQGLELIITANVDNHFPGLIPFFPMRSMSNIVEWPFPRYAFMEIKDYVSLSAVAIAGAWTILFNYFAYLKIKLADI